MLTGTVQETHGPAIQQGFSFPDPVFGTPVPGSGEARHQRRAPAEPLPVDRLEGTER